MAARAGGLIEEEANLGERLLDGSQEGPLEIGAQCFPILFAFKNEVVHPAVAALKHFDELVFHLLPIVVAPQEEGLRETVGAMHLILVEDIAEIVRRGQRECVIRENADPEQTAWMIVSRAWAEDITQLMGVRESWSEKRSYVMLDLILDAIAVVPVSG